MPEPAIQPQAMFFKTPSLPLPEVKLFPEVKTKAKQSEEHEGGFPARLALVQFEEKEIVIDIDPFILKATKPELTVESAKLAISKWIAEVYDSLGRETFSGYLSKHLSESDAKVFFTHNLALNFQHMIDYFWHRVEEFWKLHRESLIRHFEEQSMRTLDFMMVKYPQKKKTFIS